MGTYLSTPVTEKGEESGDSLDCSVVPCSWGVVDMQGWRKSMEDAHVAQTDIPLPTFHFQDVKAENSNVDAKVFGVFDGHGGPEVARFCQLYFVSVLTQQAAWKEEAPTSSSETNPSKKGVGQALVSTFHALDRMIDDVSRRDELVRLRSLKPRPGERRDADYIPEDTFTPPAQEQETPDAPPQGKQEETEAVQAEPEAAMEKKEAEDEAKPEDVEPASAEPASANDKASDEQQVTSSAPAQDREAPEGADQEKSDDDSDVVVGVQEAAEHDRELMDDGEKDDLEEDSSDPSKNSNSKVGVMFQRILNLGSPSGQVVINVGRDGEIGDAEPGNPSGIVSGHPQVAASSGPSASQPSLIHNGRMICNLPDHPIHAGCTAIVAVIAGRTLTVANAGDSRAVLCRADGQAVALSYDHKPQQEREMTRISKAGGFVNHFGRVNGNLNLSRSIGDMKYKQVPGVAPADQIITAQPDIVQLTLHPKDEFIILGCDGIWDCLSNEKAVEFVYERIDKMTPTQIGVEMLDEIISEDPRVTQGIGGDNMTIMIIDLQPESRQGRSKAEESPPVEA